MFLTCLFPNVVWHTKIVQLKMHCSAAWEQKPRWEHTGGIFQKTGLMPFSWKLLPFVLQTWAALGILLQFSLLSTRWRMCSSPAHKTEKEIAFRTLKEFYGWQKTMQVQSTRISKCHPSQTEYFFPLKWDFMWKSPMFIAQNGTFSIISWINTLWNTCLSGGQQRQPV